MKRIIIMMLLGVALSHIANAQNVGNWTTNANNNYVGIGLVNPPSALSIMADGNSYNDRTLRVGGYSNNPKVAPGFTYERGRGNMPTNPLRPTGANAVQQGDIIGSFAAAGVDGDGTKQFSGGLFFNVDGPVTTQNVPMNFTVHTGLNTSALKCQMVVGSDGKVQISDLKDVDTRSVMVLSDGTLVASRTTGMGVWRVSGSNQYSLNSGNIGIGATSPQEKLHIHQTTGDVAIKVSTNDDAKIILEADRNNIDEADNAYIEFIQDGGAANGVIGFAGVRDRSPAGDTVLGLWDNALVMSTAPFPGSHSHLQLATEGKARLTIDDDGNVGIGTNTPTEMLSVNGNISTPWDFSMKQNNPAWSTYGRNIFLRRSWTASHGDMLYIGSTGNRSNTQQGAINISHQKGISFGKGSATGGVLSNTHVVFAPNGNVGIGTTNPQNKLDVCGKGRFKEVIVASGWCDYVFEKDYKLPTITEEETYIQENGHLSGFESTEEMNGEIQVADVTRRQQQKIEELMLHIIELNERLSQLEGKEVKEKK